MARFQPKCVARSDRNSHRIYKRWILEKYPDAAKFKWESINARITTPTVTIRGKIVPINQLPKFIIEGFYHNIGRPINNTFSKNNMNPYDYWYRTNEGLRNDLRKYYEHHIDLIKDKELKDDCISLFSGGSFAEKAQVLTLLSAIKQLFY